MKYTIRIKNIDKVTNTLKKIPKVLSDFTKPLGESNAIMTVAIMENIRTEGKTLGEPWEKPHIMTVKIKTAMKELGIGDISNPLKLMRRTGKLVSGFRARTSRNVLTIYNPLPYFGVHQMGGRGPTGISIGGRRLGLKQEAQVIRKAGISKEVLTARRIPQRTMLKFGREQIKLIFNTFVNWTKTQLKSLGLEIG